MSGKIKKIGAVVLAVALSAVAMSVVFAEEADKSSYGFHQGKDVHYGTGGEQTFEYAPDGADTADRSFRIGKGRRGGTDRPHYDADALVEAGIIDQETADAIAAYAAEKHTDISAMHQGMDGLTPEERHSAFEAGRTARGENGLDALVAAGIISEEQAEAIRSFTPAA